MAELTKKDLDEGLGKIDTRIDHISGTVDRTAVMVSDFVEGLKELPLRLQKIEATLEGHTISLDAIVKNTESWKIEKAALESALNRQERWIKTISNHLHLKLEDN